MNYQNKDNYQVNHDVVELLLPEVYDSYIQIISVIDSIDNLGHRSHKLNILDQAIASNKFL